MDALRLVELFAEISAQMRASLAGVDDWGLSGLRPDQYTIDVATDAIAVDRLSQAGLAILSEESGVTMAAAPKGDLVVVVDPIDGSTNASQGLPWFATSFCAVDAEGPLAAYVVNQATGDEWSAIRGQGATRNGSAISPSGVITMGDAIIAVSGLASEHLGWKQFRCFGAAALDICSVADGTFDGFMDLSVDAHGGWDYMGALLVLREAGGVIVDAHGRDLVVRSHDARRTPLAAATPELLVDVQAASDRHVAAS